jgi:hypothetical protein
VCTALIAGYCGDRVEHLLVAPQDRNVVDWGDGGGWGSGGVATFPRSGAGETKRPAAMMARHHAQSAVALTRTLRQQ